MKADFPLRGAVACASCSNQLTAGRCKGKYKHYPYYFCRLSGCDQYSKTIPRAKLEEAFRAHLSVLQPSRSILKVAAAMFRDCWEQQSDKTNAAVKAFQKDAANLQKKIAQLLERIVESDSPLVVRIG